jgi:hypothetical protein
MNQPRQSAPDERQLEQFIGSLLRRQPLRQAPSTLESRVLRELELRGAQAWWQSGFSRWPWTARLLCLPVGAILVWLSFVTTARALSVWQAVQVSAPAAAAQSGVRWFETLGLALQSLGNLITHVVPQWLLYGGAGAALLMYAAFFGLGAAAFRTLFVNPEPARYPS